MLLLNLVEKSGISPEFSLIRFSLKTSFFEEAVRFLGQQRVIWISNRKISALTCTCRARADDFKIINFRKDFT
jgi:hypothetical protein